MCRRRAWLTSGLRRSNSIHSTLEAIMWWSTKSSLVGDETSNSAGTSTAKKIKRWAWKFLSYFNIPARSPPNHCIILAVWGLCSSLRLLVPWWLLELILSAIATIVLCDQMFILCGKLYLQSYIKDQGWISFSHVMRYERVLILPLVCWGIC